MRRFTKTVQFDHLRPYYLTTNEDGTNTEHLYDLSAILRHVASNPLAATKKTVFGDVHVIHICNYIESLKLWEIQVLHLREKILPGIADGDGAYELIQLEDRQFPAESTTLLYDEARQVIYLQRNIYGTSIRALELFIQFLSPSGVSVILKPRIVGSRVNKIVDTGLYRKVILVADTEQLEANPSGTSLSQILRTFGQYQGRIVKVGLGFGYQRKGLLKADSTAQLVREAYAFNGTQKLEVQTAYNIDTAFETLDLLDDREKYQVNITYSRESPITHSRLFSECLSEYRNELGIL